MEKIIEVAAWTVVVVALKELRVRVPVRAAYVRPESAVTIGRSDDVETWIEAESVGLIESGE